MLCNAAIRLLPDWTFFVQLFIFLFVLLVLTVLVIWPMQKLIDRRRAFTNETVEGAAHLIAEAEQFELGRKEMLALALREAQAERERQATAARRDADKAIVEARVGVAELLQHGARSIAWAETLVEMDLEVLSRELAGEIEKRLEA